MSFYAKYAQAFTVINGEVDIYDKKTSEKVATCKKELAAIFVAGTVALELLEQVQPIIDKDHANAFLTAAIRACLASTKGA